MILIESIIVIIICYYYINLSLKFNKQVENLLVSYIISDLMFNIKLQNESDINKIMLTVKKLSKIERRGIYKKLYSSKSHKFVNKLMNKVKEGRLNFER